MDTTGNEERWAFLCARWNDEVDGTPFPLWFSAIQADTIEEAVDTAIQCYLRIHQQLPALDMRAA